MQFVILNPGLFRTRSIFKCLWNMSDDQADSEPWHSQNSLFKHFQAYLGIFRGIAAYSATLTDEQLRGRGEASPALFENRKKCPHFGKKDPDCIHLWVKFSIQNIVLRVSRRKNSQIFHAGPFFLVFLTKCLSKCPSSTKLQCPEKFLVAHLHSFIILFAKRSILNV